MSAFQRPRYENGQSASGPFSADQLRALISVTIYPTADEEMPNLGYAYQYEHLATAETRMQQGGVRLSAYLDWVFNRSSME